ncbi:MAG: MarR family transcriptional regulator, partial [Leptospiraceae bacterium]|nr:MarR family transcriptional regulator [Leptospiraceae bacterium]
SLAFDNKKVSELAAEIGVSLPYITSLSSKMVEKNILKRENLEADKRIVVLKLTQKGEKIYSELDKRINDFLKEKFEHLNNSEIKTFDSILKKLI